MWKEISFLDDGEGEERCQGKCVVVEELSIAAWAGGRADGDVRSG